MKSFYRILAVDDNGADLALLAEAIAEAGMPLQMDSCADGQHALEQLATRTDYDLILSDINMPRMNGIEFLHRLAAMPSAGLIPIVLMSSSERGALPKQMRGELDHLPYFTKPRDWKGFIALARTLYTVVRTCGTSHDAADALGAYVRTTLV